MSIRQVVAAFAVLFLLSTVRLCAAAPIDENLYMSYLVSSGNTSHISLSWTLCGRTQTTGGCYASGTLGTFGKVGSIVEGAPAYNLTKGTVTRSIYVVDAASGTSGNEVVLDVYKQILTITLAPHRRP